MVEPKARLSRRRSRTTCVAAGGPVSCAPLCRTWFWPPGASMRTYARRTVHVGGRRFSGRSSKYLQERLVKFSLALAAGGLDGNVNG